MPKSGNHDNTGKPAGTEFNLKEAAAFTGYCEQHLRRLAAARKIGCTMRGRLYFFSAQDLAAVVKHVEASAPAGAPLIMTSKTPPKAPPPPATEPETPAAVSDPLAQ